MVKTRITALLLLIIGAAIGYFVYATEQPNNSFAFSYGLDLAGGSRLVYVADTSEVPAQDVDGAMMTLRNTIEHRVNSFGVSEPIVAVEQGSVFGGTQNQNRLSVELPGVTDISEAIDAIGQTPLLEFRLETASTAAALITAQTATTTEAQEALVYQAYTSSGLGGGQLDRATVVFGSQVSATPQVLIQFNDEGRQLLEDITRENVGNVMAIFLDGRLVSAPVIQTEIFGGEAQITGQFTAEEARDLAQNLNFGALPVPIELLETTTIGPSLGQATLNSGVKALSIAFIFMLAFLVFWYRLPGLIASVALGFYVAAMLAIFKLVPVTLTASGVAGFILSLGMAVDANILIFERVKEELRRAKPLTEAVREGFARAWPAIRDGNITSIIAAIILFWMSGASLVKGFALVFGIGVLISMLSAVTVSRTLLLAVTVDKVKTYRKLFFSGFKNK